MLFVVAAICVLVVIALFLGAPYVPTHAKQLPGVFERISYEEGDVFYDLGFGAGGVLKAAAESGFNVKGFEINPLLWLISYFRLRRYNAKLYLRPWQGSKLEDADVIFIFTTTPHGHSKAFDQLPPSATIISFGPRLARIENQRTSTTHKAFTIYHPVAHAHATR